MRAGRVALAAAVLAALIGCAGSTVQPGDDPGWDPPPELDTRSDYPEPGDFQLAVQATARQCTDTGGCSVRYRVDATLAADVALAPNMRYRIAYQVLGAQAGPIPGSFTLTSDRVFTYDGEHVAVTDSAQAELRAEVTSVS